MTPAEIAETKRLIAAIDVRLESKLMPEERKAAVFNRGVFVEYLRRHSPDRPTRDDLLRAHFEAKPLRGVRV
jgi:hypothetical protein